MKKINPNINIERLREHSWALWDPIGLSATMGGWTGQPFEDEYDVYISKAAEMLRENRELEEVIAHLFYIQSQYIGVGPKKMDDLICAKLRTLVIAISEDHSIWYEN